MPRSVGRSDSGCSIEWQCFGRSSLVVPVSSGLTVLECRRRMSCLMLWCSIDLEMAVTLGRLRGVARCPYGARPINSANGHDPTEMGCRTIILGQREHGTEHATTRGHSTCDTGSLQWFESKWHRTSLTDSTLCSSPYPILVRVPACSWCSRSIRQHPKAHCLDSQVHNL